MVTTSTTSPFLSPSPPARRHGVRTLLAAVLVLLVAASLVVVVIRVEDPWHQVFSESFDTDVAAGQFTASGYGSRFGVYPDGWLSTAQGGTYQPTEVLSVHDGALNFWLHTTAAGPASAAVLPKVPGAPQTYGRYSVRMRADPVPGYKVAFLLWPDSEQWPADGEIDFPEGDLDGTVSAFAHHASPDDVQEGFPDLTDFSAWHTYTIEWTPGKVRFLLDDRAVGESTTLVPSKPMHWVLQTETASRTAPAPEAQGHVLVDSVRVWTYRP